MQCERVTSSLPAYLSAALDAVCVCLCALRAIYKHLVCRSNCVTRRASVPCSVECASHSVRKHMSAAIRKAACALLRYCVQADPANTCIIFLPLRCARLAHSEGSAAVSLLLVGRNGSDDAQTKVPYLSCPISVRIKLWLPCLVLLCLAAVQ